VTDDRRDVGVAELLAKRALQEIMQSRLRSERIKWGSADVIEWAISPASPALPANWRPGGDLSSRNFRNSTRCEEVVCDKAAEGAADPVFVVG